GTGDAPPAGSVGCAAHPDALFCDGFETGDTRAWDGEFDRGVDIVSDAHWGDHAGLAVTTGADQRAWVRTTLGESVSSGTLHIRAFFRIPEGTETEQINLLSTGGSIASDGIVLVVRNGQDTG